MPFEITPYAVISACAAAVALFVAMLAWQRRTVPGGTSLATLMFAVGIWSGGAAFEYASTNLPLITFWAKLEYFGGVSSPVFFLLFVLEYNHLERWLTRRMIALLFGVPGLTLGLALTNEWHGLIWPSLELGPGAPYRAIYGHGPAYWLGAVGYSYLVMLLGTGLILWSAIRFPSLYRRQVTLIALGAVVPWLINLTTVTGLSPIPDLDLTPLAFSITGILFAWGIFYFHLLDLKPIARETLIESTSDGMLVLDQQYRVVDINPAAQAMLGIAKEQALGQPLQVIAPDVCGPAQHAIQMSVDQIDVALARNGATRFYDLRVSKLAEGKSQALGYLIMARDMTERKGIEDALRANEAQLRAIFDYSPAAIILFDPEGKIQMWNTAAEKMYGWTEPEVLGRTVPSVPAVRQSERLAFQARVNQGELISYTEVQRQRKDGSPIQVGLSVAPLRDAAGKVYAQMSITADITALKHAQAELQRREQTVAILEERARLGRNLHDSVTQLLYSMMLFADASRDAAQTENLALARQYLDRLSETARQALKQMRLQIYEMRPSILEQEGLASALRQRLAAVEEHGGVETVLRVQLPDPLSAPVEVAVYWIVQEALNNILKHSDATRVEIEISTDASGLHCDIVDNGKGVDPATVREHTGLGLTNMQERAHDLGGTLEILSAPERGTRIRVHLPAYVVDPNATGSDFRPKEPAL